MKLGYGHLTIMHQIERTVSHGEGGAGKKSPKSNLFRNPIMLKRFQDISLFPEKEKECILTTIDRFIRASKIALI